MFSGYEAGEHGLLGEVASAPGGRKSARNEAQQSANVPLLKRSRRLVPQDFPDKTGKITRRLRILNCPCLNTLKEYQMN